MPRARRLTGMYTSHDGVFSIDLDTPCYVATSYTGDGTLPAVWMDRGSLDAGAVIDGGLATALIFVCPFAYGAYYGDCGANELSDPMLLAEVAAYLGGLS